MNQTFPETRIRLLALLTLACCTATAAAQIAAAQFAAAPFNPFTDHDSLSPDLTWIIQVENPAAQINSLQAKSLSAAIAQTDLLAESSKAWARLSRTLSDNRDESLALLGRRAQFIAGPKHAGLPWAIVIEIDPDQRRTLLTKLKTFPRTYRHKRPISDMEDGRYLLSVFDRGDLALALLAPRSDRTLKPARDPKAALFFQMFDLLAGTTAHGARPTQSPLAAPIKAVGPGELIIARKGNGPSKNATEETDFDAPRENGGGTQEPEFTVLRLDRAAGGWAGEFLMSAPKPKFPNRFTSQPPSQRLADALPTISWIAFTPEAVQLQPAWAAELESISNLLPGIESTSRFIAMIDTDPASKGAAPAFAMVHTIDADTGPAEIDAALATLLSGHDTQGVNPPVPEGPDHGGKYPQAVRVQTFNSASFMGPRASIAWRFSSPTGNHRTMALVIAHEPEPSSSAIDAYHMVNTLLLASSQAQEPNPTLASGRLRLSVLQRFYRDHVPTDTPPMPLLERIESVSWSLTPTQVGTHPAVQGPVSVLLVPTRPAELGSK